MTISVDELATKATSLPDEARALLAERLVESLDQESIRDIWLTEAKRRRDEVRGGRVEPIQGIEAMESVRRLINDDDILISSPVIQKGQMRDRPFEKMLIEGCERCEGVRMR